MCVFGSVSIYSCGKGLPFTVEELLSHHRLRLIFESGKLGGALEVKLSLRTTMYHIHSWDSGPGVQGRGVQCKGLSGSVQRRNADRLLVLSH